MEQSPKIKVIKKDAVIDIKVGTGFLQKLQKVMMSIAANVTEEDIEKYKTEAEKIKDGHQFTEDWMDNLTTMSILLKELETKAEEQGFTYDQNFDDIKVDED